MRADTRGLSDQAQVSLCDLLEKLSSSGKADAGQPLELAKRQAIDLTKVAVPSVLVVTAGLVKLSEGAPPRAVGFYLPDEIIALVNTRPSQGLSLQALLPSSLRVIPLSEVQAVWRRHPKLGAALIERLSDQLVREQQARLSVTSHQIERRVAYFFMDMAKRTDVARDRKPEVLLPMRRCDIADYLGIRVETLSRLLTRWRTAGVIRFPSPRRAVVLDRRYLQALVRGQELGPGRS